MRYIVWCLLCLVWLTSGSAQCKPKFAIVVHGGAGADPAKMDEQERAAVEAGMQRALRHGVDRLKAGASSLDVAEEVVRILEDDPWFNAGRGAALDEDGQAELDAAIMNGRTLACGAVASVRRVKNPVSLARQVMEKTRHVLIVGEGAERLAKQTGQTMVEPGYFVTERTREALRKLRRKSQGTVGCVVLDERGDLAAATSTGGLTGKKVGRVGDSPIIGAGTYADNRTCGVSCTGVGEEFIRQAVAFQITMRMRFKGDTLAQAIAGVFKDSLQPDIGGVIAIDSQGNIVMHFNTPGMARGAADADGRFETGIGP